VRVRRTIELEDPELVRALLGDGDRHLRRVREALGVNVVVRRERLHVDGPQDGVEKGVQAFERLIGLVRSGRSIGSREVENVLRGVRDTDVVEESFDDIPDRRSTPGGDTLAGRVHPITDGQSAYVKAMREHDVVFAIGPAGTGKTYLAVAMAAEYLARHSVHRLILVRPAVEAGEHLGFLPGDLREKVNPYLRPLYDALHDLISPNQVARFMERDVIEVAPLAFMRGRTLNHAFVILDEAQNTTPKQMLMFLTRLGHHARAVITGDITQVDLPDRTQSGLAHARDVLMGTDGVAFVHLEKRDIVRHPLVQRIVDAYEAHGEGLTDEAPASDVPRS
jgi:phosphate starvation-inducible PhoH-like protein